MTEKELITIVETNQAKINELHNEISTLATNTDYLVKEYIRNESKYKVGEVVNRTTEKYKVPRKYIVQRVWGFVEQNDDTKFVKILYELATANGHKPNAGWSVEEKYLKLAK